VRFLCLSRVLESHRHTFTFTFTFTHSHIHTFTANVYNFQEIWLQFPSVSRFTVNKKALYNSAL